jgi:hypothetical protein
VVSTSLGKTLRGNLGPGRRTSGRVVRYEGNLRLIVRALRKASEQRGPSLEVCKDEGWWVLSMMAEYDRLGEQAGYMRNWQGSCLVLAQRREKVYEVLTNPQDNEPTS